MTRTPPSLPERIEFGYWSDPMCIWALVAQPRLDHILATFGDALAVDYHVVPVFGSIRWRFAHEWAGVGVNGRVAATRRIASEHGRDDVTGECWRDHRPASSWSPGAAFEAIADMERAGLARRGAAADYLRHIREAFFVDNLDIARRAVQLQLAETLDIPRAPIEQRLDDGTALALLWEDHRLREELHIQGSPTYLFDGGRARLYGDFSAGILEATVRELLRGQGPGRSHC